jgi:ubiquinone/menaquinone biosynthesis C-methylase UbiE
MLIRALDPRMFVAEIRRNTMESFASPAQAYEKIFVPAMFGALADRLLAREPVRAGDRVLDLACGTGAVARRLAPMVGPSGRLVAADLRDAMLAVARSLPRPEGAPIEWRQADATKLPFDDHTNDRVICQHGLQIFDDRAKALAEVRRVLTPGGKVVASVWKSLDVHPLWKALTEAEARLLGPLGVTYEEAAMPFLLGDSDELRRLFEEAGFVGIEIGELTLEGSFAAATFVRDVEFAYSAIMPQFASNPRAFDAYVETVERDMRDVIHAHMRGSSVTFPLHAHVVVAHVEGRR